MKANLEGDTIVKILTLTCVGLVYLVGTGIASGASRPQGFWNRNVCKPIYLTVSPDHPARITEACQKDVTLHVYVNGHSQILDAYQFRNTATFYGNESVIRIHSTKVEQVITAVTASPKPARVRVRFTPDWQTLGG